MVTMMMKMMICLIYSSLKSNLMMRVFNTSACSAELNGMEMSKAVPTIPSVDGCLLRFIHTGCIADELSSLCSGR